MARMMIGMIARLAAAAVAAALSLAAPLRAGAPEPAERWYELTIAGERVGWAKHSLDADGRGNITTRQEVSFAVRRMGVEMTMEIVSAFTETAAKQPVSMRSEQTLAAGKSVTAYVFDAPGGGVSMTVEGPDGRRTEQLPAPPPGWLTPMGVRELVEQKLAEGADRFSFTMIEPTLGLTPGTVTQRKLGPAKVMIDGREFEGIEWEVEQSATPGVFTREIIGPDGWPLRTVTPMMGFEIVMTASSRDAATKPAGSVELVRPLLVRPDKPMTNARASRRAVYLVKSDEKPLPDIPATGAQTAKRLDARTIRVTVDLDRNRETAFDEHERAALLASTSLVNWKSACVAGCVKEALAGLDMAASSMERAARLRDFAAGRLVNVGLGVGMAGSDEVCRTRAGDCTEFAVLLAAMLRAEGIPSRVVCGLVYCDELLGEEHIFGPHMWTQAYVERRGRKEWVDVDAALGPGERVFDAGHIAFSTTPLPDDSGASSFMRLVGFLGSVRVEIVEEK